MNRQPTRKSARLLTSFLFVFSIILPAPISLAQTDIVPNFQAPRLQGGTLSLDSLRGRTVILHFWSPFCSVCPTELKSLDTLRRLLLGEDVEIVSVMTMDTSDRAVEAAKQLRSGLPILVDTGQALAEQFNIKLLPVTIIIGPDGTLMPIEDPQQPGSHASRFDGVRSWGNEAIAKSLVQAHQVRKSRTRKDPELKTAAY